MPLDDFIKRDKYDMNRFAPLVVPEAKGLDGKWYALIRSVDNRLLYWNKEAFQEVGLDPDKAPATWDELKQFAIRLTKRGSGAGGFDRIGFTPSTARPTTTSSPGRTGAPSRPRTARRPRSRSAQNQEALQWMADLVKDIGGWDALEEFRKSWGTNAQDPFILNQLAMVYQTDGARHQSPGSGPT